MKKLMVLAAGLLQIPVIKKAREPDQIIDVPSRIV